MTDPVEAQRHGGGKNQTVGFVEKFALAEDRAEALKELIPGTEDYYYFHALHHQLNGDNAAFDRVIEDWAKRDRSNGTRENLLLRQALLDYSDNPEESLKAVALALNLRFDQSRQTAATPPDLPTSLDQKQIAFHPLLASARKRNDALSLISPEGLDRIVRTPKLLNSLKPAELRALLFQLKRPDAETLVQAISKELAMKDSKGFGSLQIHQHLTVAQLDELAKATPIVLRDPNFVSARIRRLLPGADSDMDRQPEVRRAYLQELSAFVSELDPVFADLKANVLFERLEFARDVDKEYPKDLFLEFLKLPRNSPLLNPDYLRKNPELARQKVNLESTFKGCPFPPVINREEELIRDYLEQYFKTDDSTEPYTTLLKEPWVKAILAETRILMGDPDVERWASLLSPSAFQTIKNRVEIVFAPGNPEHHKVDSKVSLSVDVKNVEKLIVKVFEINTLGLYRTQDREVNTDLELDGLVGNSEKTFTYDEPSALRHRETFDFPEIDARRGVWIIEFIGNAQSSRAVIRKGQLTHIAQPSTAGATLAVLDESHKLVPTAVAWFANRKYEANDEGLIKIPFSSAGSSNIIVADRSGSDAYASLGKFNAPSENYQLDAKFHIERESLMIRNKAKLIIRPAIYSNGIPTTFALLDKPTLTVVAYDQDGIPTTEVIPNYQLYPDRESVYEFTVPDRLKSVSATLSGRVKLLTGENRPLQVDSGSIPVNDLYSSNLTATRLFSKDSDGYFVDVLGRNGEPLPDRAVAFQFHSRFFNEAKSLNLKTGANGRIRLGALADIRYVTADWNDLQGGLGFSPERQSDARTTLPRSLHSHNGQPILIPFQADLSRAQASLFEMRAGANHTDRFDQLKVEDGFLRAEDLAPGDYVLTLKQQFDSDREHSIAIRVTAPEVVTGGLAMGANRSLELLDQRPLQIVSVEDGADAVTVRLANALPTTRIHVAASRYFTEGRTMFDNLNGIHRPEPRFGTPAHRPNLYLTGRRIGDEYRYVIDRKYAAKFPGIMAPRPSLLLNPWAIQETSTGIASAKAGSDFKKAKNGRDAKMDSSKSEMQDRLERAKGGSSEPDLNFLANPAPVLANLAPEIDPETGVATLTIPHADLGDRHLIHVLAADHRSLAFDTLTRPAPKDIKLRDLRLRRGLDPEKDFTQQQEITVLEAGKKLLFPDPQSTRVEVYDTLAKAHALFLSLGVERPEHFQTFDFILKWPQLEPAEKRSLYSKHACHELSFFLAQRDPDFFTEVISPYLENKRDKTFIDRYLLEHDLTGYLQPYEFNKLNAAERALLLRRVDDPESRAQGVRHLADLVALRPLNPQLRRQRFEAAVRSGSLQSDDIPVFTGAALGIPEKDAEGNESAFRGATKKSGEIASAGVARQSLSKMSRSLNAPMSAPTPVAEPMPAPGAPAKAKGQTNSNGVFASGGISGGGFAGALVGDTPMIGRLFDDASERDEVRQMFRRLGATKEWAENNYYNLPIQAQDNSLIAPNAFWRDFAAWDGKGVFLSEHLTDACTNFSETMLALSVIGLPYEAEKHTSNVDDNGFELTPASPCIVFHEEIKPAPDGDANGSLLVAQHFYRISEKTTRENGVDVPRWVTEEFLKGVVYGCSVVVSNPTAQPHRFDLITQIPQGAIAVAGARPTNSQTLVLNPYCTHEVEYQFYFPTSGVYPHYPVHASQDGKVAAETAPFTFNVVDELTKIDTKSWQYISQNAEPDAVFDYLRENNLAGTNVAKLAWRCREDKAFTERLCEFLTENHRYNQTIFSFGIHHDLPEITRQFLLHSDQLTGRVGPALESPLLTVDPIGRKTYQHLEYNPLVNARAHVLGGERKILNPNLHRQHHSLMNILAHRAKFDADDQMAVVYALMLQDRYAEALKWFDKVDADALETKIQFDYFATIAAMLRLDLAAAKGIADQYVDYPVDRWRSRFAEARAHLDAADGDAPDEADPDAKDGAAREQQQDALATTEPSLDIELGKPGTVDLNFANLDSVEIALYEMDLEFLFSTSPFVSGGDTSRFAVIKPNHSAQLVLDTKKRTHNFELPGEFRKSDVLVQVTGAGLQRSVAVYANELEVDLVENYGRLEVRHAETGKALPKTYIKVYSLGSGGVRFHKDGYTDLRGRFDYASINTGESGDVTRMSILIMHDEHGAMVKEVQPPTE